MSDRRTMSKLAAWHAGEKAIQQRVGVAEKMEAAVSYTHLTLPTIYSV